jgi:hypothetical protein
MVELNLLCNSRTGLSASARPSLWAHSRLRFNISLFSQLSQNGRPILRLRDLFVACSNIEV